MRKILLFILFVSFHSMFVHADGIKFLEDGKEWKYEVTNPSFDNKLRYVISGDTTIADVLCKKLVAYLVDNGTPFYKGALYEDGQKVYFFPSGKSEAVLLYDFSLSVGDKAEVARFDTSRGKATMNIVVTGETTVEVDGKAFRVLSFDSNFDNTRPDGYSYGGWWIDGVGCITTLIPLGHMLEWCWNELRSVTIGGEAVDVVTALRRQQNGNRMAYRPLLTDGKRWKYEFHHFEENGETMQETVFDRTYYFDGDTLINGQSWRKMYCQDGDLAPAYVGAWREEGKKVYRIYQGRDEVELLYDFDMLSSEITKAGGSDDFFYFTHVDTVEVNGIQYLRHHFRDRLQPVGINCYVEGIGGQMGCEPFPLPVATSDRDRLYYLGVYEGDELLFTPEDYLKEPVTTPVELSQTTANPQHHDGTVYDLSGRRVSSTPKGVYIQNGKKIIIN